MRNYKRYCLVLIVVMLASLSGWSQGAVPEKIADTTQPATLIPGIQSTLVPANSTFVIRQIIITGNKKTRDKIILREIPFKQGDTFSLQDMVKKFEEGRRLLMNTALFHDVVVALKNFDGYQVDVSVAVRERWYLFPLPYLRPIDRNLNQWLVQQHGDLSRVNYGVKLLYNNATGNNDKFRLWLIGGYTRQFSVDYDRLYFDKKMHWGIKFDFSIGKNREVNYNTIDDKQVFLKVNDYIRSFITANVEVTFRKAIKTRQYFGIGFTQEDIKDTVIALNPSYFKEGRDRIRYPEVYYKWTYYDLDYNPYPTKGYAAEVTVGKKGINHSTNVWELSVKGSGSWHVGRKSYFNLLTFGGIKLPFHQPYYNLRFFGYNDVYMQGYEYYVIDGVGGGYAKATLARELFNFVIKTPTHKGLPAQGIPVHIYGKIYGNAGYVYNPQPGDNSLSNTMLYSGGLGIDVLTLYDFTIKLEWTFNQIGENGLFLHRRSIF